MTLTSKPMKHNRVEDDMSKRAKFQTAEGNLLTVSRGVLTVVTPETGGVQELAINGTVAFDEKTKQLRVPLLNVTISEDRKRRDIETREVVYSIVKTPAQFREETQKAYTKEELAKLMEKWLATPPTVQKTEEETNQVLNVDNPAFIRLDTTLRQFCRKYGFDYETVTGKNKTAPKRKAS